jgi:hypothetical protein
VLRAVGEDLRHTYRLHRTLIARGQTALTRSLLIDHDSPSCWAVCSSETTGPIQGCGWFT